MSAPRRRISPVPAIVAVIACCGLKVLLVAAVLGSAGVVFQNVVLFGVGVALLVALVVWAGRRRTRCSSSPGREI